jgi:2',3'-cyclic-nucleotide 2'-phosphodiesterase (5'-nucleotidase family)
MWVKEVRESTKGVLVLDAGDLLFKKFSNPIREDELKMVAEKAHLILESFNLMGYDTVGIGDDDLSLGKEFLLDISKKANFPFLSTNLIDEESGQDLFPPYVLKKVNGLRIGIFSLLSPDSFLGQGDPRRKGLVFKSPIETAQNMVKELQPQTDLIILLSHLSYPKDVEVAHTISGIHLIIGSHTGINFVFPPTINNGTIILQTAPKGMYAGRFDLTFYHHEPTFYNKKTRQIMEQNLRTLNSQLSEGRASEAEKAQWRRLKEGIEQTLKKLHGKNEFTNRILPLNEQIKDHPDIGKMVDAFRSKFPEPGKSQSPK